MNTLMNFVMGGALLVMVAVIYLPLDHYLLSDPADRRGGFKGYLSRWWHWVVTFRCTRCGQRKSSKEKVEWWGHVMCSTCMTEYQRQLHDEELKRQLDEAIAKELLLVEARKRVQAMEEAKKNYRNH